MKRNQITEPSHDYYLEQNVGGADMNLFLDDTRDFPKWGYECCRDSKTAIRLLSIMNFESITLDYSLGGEDTGMAVLVWMSENNKHVPHINIHSNHIIGRERMREFCEKNFPNSKITTDMLPK